MQQRLPSLLTRPIAFAHRGARAHAQENTIDAFALALRLGATGLESDVWLTSDGVPVLDHDGVVRAGWRKRAIADLRRDELPPHIPALAELLERCGHDYDLSLDVKDVRAAEVVISLVREAAPALLPRLWLCEPDVGRLSELRRVDADVRLVNSTRLNRIKEGPERRAAVLSSAGVDAVNLPHQDWTGGLTTLFHRFERVCFAWDLQFEHQMRPIVRMGMDGLYSDHVDRMIDALTSELGPG